MDECIDSMGEALIFSTLDANSDYEQIEIHPKDREQTAPTRSHGFFPFTRMPLRLRNVPAIFQTAMYAILSSVK